MNVQSRHVGFFVGGALVAGSLVLISCSTEDADPDGGGGSSGSGTAGSGGGSGGSAAGSGGSGGSAAGSGGSGGTGGAPMDCTPQPAPATGLLMDFETTATAFGSFGNPPTDFSGGIFVYPNMEAMPAPMYPLTSTVADGVWHITGTVGDYSGFGFFFPCRADVSTYDGIEFTISGTIGTPPLTMRFGQTSNTYEAPGSTETPQGTCVPASTTNPGASCTEPKITIDVTENPVTHSITWAEFTGGLPNDMAVPAEFMNFSWYFSWPAPMNYEIDITIDNVRFMGGPTGSGGTGGNGGSGGTTGDAGMGGTP